MLLVMWGVRLLPRHHCQCRGSHGKSSSLSDHGSWGPAPPFLLEGCAKCVTLHQSDCFSQATDCWVKVTHDNIQWVFALEQHSRHNSLALILTRQDPEVFHLNSPPEHLAMLAVLRRMLQFYGLEEVPGENGHGDMIEVRYASNFAQQVATMRWIEPTNPNALRLTRTMTLSRLAHPDPYANALRQCLLSPGKSGTPAARFLGPGLSVAWVSSKRPSMGPRWVGCLDKMRWGLCDTRES